MNHDAPGRLQKARGLLQQGFLKDALKILARLADEAPETPGLNVTYGTALASAGQWPLASTYLKRALQNNLDQPDVLNNLAVCHRAMGKYAEGLDNLDYALKLAPQFVDGWINKANLHNDLQEPRKAALCLTRAVALKPEDEGPWMTLIQSHSLAGEYDKALAVSRKAQKRFPRQENFLGAEIFALLALEKYQEAIEQARQWEEKNNTVAVAGLYLHCLKESGEETLFEQELNRLGDKYGDRRQLLAVLAKPDQQQAS